MAGDYSDESKRLLSALSAVFASIVFLSYASSYRGFLSVGDTLGAAIMVLLFFYSFGLMLYAFLDLDKNRVVAGLGVLLLLVSMAHAMGPVMEEQEISGDVRVFTVYASQLVLQGENPYEYSMREGLEKVEGATGSSSPKTDGSHVDRFSYPAGHFLLFVPQVALGVNKLGLTAVILFALSIVFLVHESRRFIALAVFPVVLLDSSVLGTILHGAPRGLWLLPVLLSMKYWKSDRLKLSMVFLGVAFSIKQMPWAIAFFLAAWLYRDNDWTGFLEKMKTAMLYGGGTFFLINAPFLLTAPMDWAKGVFTPLSSAANLLGLGQGLASVTLFSTFTVSKTFFTLSMIGFIGLMVGVYLLYFERLKWTAWFVPGIVLFFNYRFAVSYFIYFVPIIYYAFLMQFELEGERWLDDVQFI